MKEYKRITTKKSTSENTKIVYNENNFAIFDKELVETLLEEHNRLWELENQIENGTLKKVVRCKDCIYFQPEYVEMENKERRPYTEEEIKNGKFISIEKGINCGSRCKRFNYWDKNLYPVWFNENDFCSYGKLKELQKDDI